MTNQKGIINIHGKDYMTVARRVELAQEDKAIEKMLTEVIPTGDNHVVIRATLKVKGIEYTGISSVDLQSSRQIEKSNPYEVAETSAVGRALGFAGYGLLEGIASADEIIKATQTDPSVPDRQINDDSTETQPNFCIGHNKAMKERFSKDGNSSWFDHRWQENGEWQQCRGINNTASGRVYKETIH